MMSLGMLISSEDHRLQEAGELRQAASENRTREGAEN